MMYYKLTDKKKKDAMLQFKAAIIMCETITTLYSTVSFIAASFICLKPTRSYLVSLS